MRKFVKGLTTVAALALTASFAFAANVEIDVTDYAVIDGSDGNNTLFITPETDKEGNVTVEGYFSDSSNLDKVYAITYYIQLNDYSTVTNDDGDLDYAAWTGGAVGTNSSAGWNARGGQFTTAVDSGKSYILGLPGVAAADRTLGDLAADTEVGADGTVALTVDTTDLFTTDEDEYARGFLQDYSGDNACSITKVTITVDESIAGDTAGASDAAADDTTADDTNAADDTTTTEAPAATTDSSAKTGDATSVVALAGLAVVALAGAVVSSKKRA